MNLIKNHQFAKVLGCTSPSLNASSFEKPPIVVFVADGRFHMEAAMIANPTLTFYQYNPYNKVLKYLRSSA